MQIKTTMRYHLTLVRMAIIKKSTRNLLTLLRGMEIATDIMENGMEDS